MSAGQQFHNRAPAVADQRLGLQQLHTVTGGRPADGSVMTADVTWMACQTTVGGLQPVRMVPCRSVTDTRLLPACTKHTRGLSTSGNWQGSHLRLISVIVCER